jgi:hypothetical protein
MTKQQIFPIVLMALDLAAGAVYAGHGDWKKAIYWVAAAVLTATVTF